MKSTAIKLIAFTVFTAAITVGLLSVIGNFNPLASRYRLEVPFTDATGLLKGDIVQLAGVNVGKVKSTRVENDLAVAELLIDKKALVPTDSRVEIRYRNLIGQRLVLLTPGKATMTFSDGQRVPLPQTRGPLDLGAVFNNLRPLLSTVKPEDINTLSRFIVETLRPHESDITAILSDTAKLTTELGSKDKEVASMVANLDTVVSSFASQSEQLKSLLSNLSALSSVVAKRSGSIDETLKNLDSATGNFGKLISDNEPSLDKDLKDLANLLAIVKSHQTDLAQIAGHLDDQLRATARATTTGEWANLYVFSLCNYDGTSATSYCFANSGSSTATARGPR